MVDDVLGSVGLEDARSGAEHYVQGALAAGKSYLMKRQIEVMQDIACHEAEMGRLASERAVLEGMLAQLEKASPTHPSTTDKRS